MLDENKATVVQFTSDQFEHMCL